MPEKSYTASMHDLLSVTQELPAIGATALGAVAGGIYLGPNPAEEATTANTAPPTLLQYLPRTIWRRDLTGVGSMLMTSYALPLHGQPNPNGLNELVIPHRDGTPRSLFIYPRSLSDKDPRWQDPRQLHPKDISGVSETSLMYPNLATIGSRNTYFLSVNKAASTEEDRRLHVTGVASKRKRRGGDISVLRTITSALEGLPYDTERPRDYAGLPFDGQRGAALSRHLWPDLIRGMRKERAGVYLSLHTMRGYVVLDAPKGIRADKNYQLTVGRCVRMDGRPITGETSFAMGELIRAESPPVIVNAGRVEGQLNGRRRHIVPADTLDREKAERLQPKLLADLAETALSIVDSTKQALAALR